jgi:hypothetical protein
MNAKYCSVFIAILSLCSFLPLRGQKSQQHLYVVVEHGRYGFIDGSGSIAIQPQFWWATDFDEDGYATVYVCGRIASIDTAGSVGPYRDATGSRLEPMRHGENFGFVSASGKLQIEPRFDRALPFSDGLAAVQVGESWGFINAHGDVVIPLTFKAAYYFREGVGLVEGESGYEFIDKNAHVLASGFEQLSGVTNEGRIPVSRNGKHGYLDLQGRVVIPLKYDDALTFFHGLAPVKKGDKWGYIDRSGREVLAFKFDEAGEFRGGLAAVRIGSKSGFIDGGGTFAFYLDFQNAPGFYTHDAEALVSTDSLSRFWTKDDKFGYVNSSGKVVWGPIQESPDHAPLFGWTDEDKQHSCEGLNESIRKTAKTLPEK